MRQTVGLTDSGLTLTRPADTTNEFRWYYVAGSATTWLFSLDWAWH
jgi:hypothetical protein